MNENNIQLTDQELRCLVYFINMKLPEFLAEYKITDMTLITALASVFTKSREAVELKGLKLIELDEYPIPEELRAKWAVLAEHRNGSIKSEQ